MAESRRIPRKQLIGVAAVVVVIAPLVLFTQGPPEPIPTPPGSFSFAALGDAPYYAWEEIKYGLVIDDLNAHDLSLVLHVGDIFWRPCSVERYERSLASFRRVRHPVVYTPGDNEWTDCWEPRVGGYVPLDRLGILRDLFFSDPTRSLGRSPLALESQASDPGFAEFVEHARWSVQGIVFATLHLVGSRNAGEPFPGRTAADDEAATRRTAAAVSWLEDAFEQAHATDAPAVVLGFHADPGFGEPPTEAYRQSYEPFIERLEEEAERFDRPVLMVHGDGHEFLVDSPIFRRTTGERMGLLGRLQVPGSPAVGWVHVVVTPGNPVRFSIESRVVPGWKFW